MDVVLKNNLEKVLENVKASAKKAGRSHESIRIVPATKTVPALRINELLSYGIDTIGENRVQELLEKYDGLDKRFKIHFIGKLQTNKVKYIVDKVEMIHSVDSEKLCAEISKRAQAVGKVMKILIEVNIGKEESKSGVLPENAEELVRIAATYPGVKVEGIMVIPPKEMVLLEENGMGSQKIYTSKGYFKKVKDLSLDILDKKIDNVSMSELSMGMSEDYCEAIECGATIIRPGRTIFGERK